MTQDIFVYYAPFPWSVKEVVLPCIDGYCIYLNKNIPREEQEKAYQHALRHIELGHFDMNCDKDVQQMEIEAHYDKTKEVS